MLYLFNFSRINFVYYILFKPSSQEFWLYNYAPIFYVKYKKLISTYLSWYQMSFYYVSILCYVNFQFNC